jgi:hypothetical protein
VRLPAAPAFVAICIALSISSAQARCVCRCTAGQLTTICNSPTDTAKCAGACLGSTRSDAAQLDLSKKTDCRRPPFGGSTFVDVRSMFHGDYHCGNRMDGT